MNKITWPRLISELREIADKQDETAMEQIETKYPVDVRFYLFFSNRYGDEEFSNLPFFGDFSKAQLKIIEKISKKDSINEGEIAAFGPVELGTYRTEPGVGRLGSYIADGSIVSVSSCLEDYGSVSTTDAEELSRLAFNAIEHYSKIPIVSFIFSMLVINNVDQYADIADALKNIEMNIFKSTEYLLLALYNDLPESGKITDELVKEKLLDMIGAPGDFIKEDSTDESAHYKKNDDLPHVTPEDDSDDEEIIIEDEDYDDSDDDDVIIIEDNDYQEDSGEVVFDYKEGFWETISILDRFPFTLPLLKSTSLLNLGAVLVLSVIFAFMFQGFALIFAVPFGITAVFGLLKKRWPFIIAACCFLLLFILNLVMVIGFAGEGRSEKEILILYLLGVITLIINGGMVTLNIFSIFRLSRERKN